jgi:hypothetical protein
LSFDPCNRSENLGARQDSNSQGGSSLGSVKVHSLTFSYTPKSMRRDSQASFLAHNLASPCFGHEPKAKVATEIIYTNVMDQVWKVYFSLKKNDFFCLFLSMTIDNTLLVDYMPHKNMFNPPFNAMSSLTPLMGPIQIIIICLESFSLIWNPYIRPKCGFIN